MDIKRNWRILLKHKIAIIMIIIIVSVSVTLLIFSPSILSFIFPHEHVQLVDVKYPNEVYRSNDLPISVSVSNVGGFGKDALIEIYSKDNPTLSLRTSLSTQSLVVNQTIFLPSLFNGISDALKYPLLLLIGNKIGLVWVFPDQQSPKKPLNQKRSPKTPIIAW